MNWLGLDIVSLIVTVLSVFAAGIIRGYSGFGFGSLTGYGYLIDFEDSTDKSQQTWGVRFSGATKAVNAAVHKLDHAGVRTRPPISVTFGGFIAGKCQGRPFINQYHICDARRIDALLPPKQFIDVTITSPPYRLR